MIKKTKFSTITAVMTTIAALAAIGSVGGGIGLGQQQQTALAQPVDPRDIGEDGIAVGNIGDTVRDILEDDDEEDDDNGGGEVPTLPSCGDPDRPNILLCGGVLHALEITQCLIETDPLAPGSCRF